MPQKSQIANGADEDAVYTLFLCSGNIDVIYACLVFYLDQNSDISFDRANTLTIVKHMLQ